MALEANHPTNRCTRKDVREGSSRREKGEMRGSEDMNDKYPEWILRFFVSIV